MAYSIIAIIEVNRITSTELPHKRGRASFCYFLHKNMEMIGHEYPGANCDKGFTTIKVLQYPLRDLTENKGFGTVGNIEQLFKPLMIFFGEKNLTLLNATIVNVIILSF